MCASVAEIVVGIVVAVIIVGGFGGYIGYKIWAKNTANAVAVATAGVVRGAEYVRLRTNKEINQNRH